ncbi:MAG: hypothetical protein RR646_06725 [Erysipelotrichaceae bacterium]
MNTKEKTLHFDDEDTFTQFSYACHQLGVEIITTSVAQAKGRSKDLIKYSKADYQSN